MLRVSLAELIQPIQDSCQLVAPADYSGAPMAATRELIRRGVKNLHLTGLPISTLQADMLIGAGCVASIETAAVTLGEFGPAPRFCQAVSAGAITIQDSTCPAIHARLQATEKGAPFMPLRGLLGSDIVAHRPDWRIIDNPFAPAADPIVLLPALAPDVMMFHAPMADAEGNIWIGRNREVVVAVHAAKKTLVTVEKFYEGNFFDDETLAAGVIPAFYIEAIARVEQGAWPLGLADHYVVDARHMNEYARLARTEAGFAEYLARYVLTAEAA